MKCKLFKNHLKVISKERAQHHGLFAGFTLAVAVAIAEEITSVATRDFSPTRHVP